MDIEINEVQEIIKNLESSGELSIKEEKYLNVAKMCVQLAAENSFLMYRIDWPKQQCPTTGDVTDVEPADFIPATDRIVAGIKADGVEEFSKTLEGAADICGKSKALEAQENLLDFASRGFEFAKQLRDGGSHD